MRKRGAYDLWRSFECVEGDGGDFAVGPFEDGELVNRLGKREYKRRERVKGERRSDARADNNETC
jgi:hypothetical protein